MNFLDIILFAFIVLAFILGFKDGFVRKLIGSIGFFLGIFLAVRFSTMLGKVIFSVTGIELYLADIMGGFLIFIVTVIVASLIKRVVHPFDKVNNLINRIVGGIIGIVQILFFLSAALYILNIFSVPSAQGKDGSYLYSHIYKIIPSTIDIISDYEPDAKDSIKNFLIEKDSI